MSRSQTKRENYAKVVNFLSLKSHLLSRRNYFLSPALKTKPFFNKPVRGKVARAQNRLRWKKANNWNLCTALGFGPAKTARFSAGWKIASHRVKGLIKCSLHTPVSAIELSEFGEKKFPVLSSAEYAERFLERSNIGTKLNKSFFRIERAIGGSLKSCLTLLLNESSFCVNRRAICIPEPLTKLSLLLTFLCRFLLWAGTKKSEIANSIPCFGH